MEGLITSFSGNVLTFYSDYFGGGASWTGWSVSLTGVIGSSGATGPAGATGSNSTANKLIKNIGTTTYTLLSTDYNYILHFTASTTGDIVVTIPAGLPTYNRYEGRQMGTSQITFTYSTTSLLVSPSSFAKTYDQYSVFSIDWVGTEQYILYGKLAIRQ